MIPQRCYSDLHRLIEAVNTHRQDCCRGTVEDAAVYAECRVFITALERILLSWEEADDKELSAMEEEYERSEKDCMWEVRE